MSGIFYGVGVGPGDPELMTLKALRILNEVDVIIAPESAPGKGSVASEIIHGKIDNPGKILALVFPMTYNRDALNNAWQSNLEATLALLRSGKNVAFITLGDPMLYSTCAHLMRYLAPHAVHVESIPGVPALCAVASRLQRPLAEENQTLLVVPAAYQQAHIDALLALVDNVAVMKPSRGYAALTEQLDAHGFLDNAALVAHCGRGAQHEKVTHDLRSVDPAAVDYLSLILASKASKKTQGNPA